jgi:hypothetical protein
MRTIHDGHARRGHGHAHPHAHPAAHDAHRRPPAGSETPLLPAGFSVDRRRFLKSSLSAVGAYAAVAAGGAWLVGPDKAWAVQFDALDADLAKGLLVVVRAIYPHERIGDVYYAQVVKDLDVEASGFDDKERLEAIRSGLRQLDAAAGGSFISADPDAREEALKTIADTQFFKDVRGKAVVSLYNQFEVWKLFGYEGESYSHGGYLQAGFQDLTFLPDPPAEASPPVEL